MSKKKANRKKCPECGDFNELRAAYCGQCGTALNEGERSSEGTGRREFSYTAVVAIIAVIVAAGVVFKFVKSTSNRTYTTGTTYEQPSPVGGPIEEQVRLVATNFRCACGGCGELPLDECTCDMPRGAVEEKAFIRASLNEGFSVDQVIDLVENKYGLRNAS
jgi:hypothetical protein